MQNRSLGKIIYLCDSKDLHEMMDEYSDAAYDAMIEKLFVRFPSFQKVGGQAYKPGIASQEIRYGTHSRNERERLRI